MTDAMDSTPLPLEARNEPVRRRSVERVDRLLDTAAEIIDQLGVNALTTSDVAARSGSSVGIVYRYFPNIDSLLLALASRNMTRYIARFEGRAAREGLPDWHALVRHAVHAYADLAREEPGFRRIRFGDVVLLRFPDPAGDANSQIARQFGTILLEAFGFRGGGEFEHELEVAIEIADALTRRAFSRDPGGEDAFIERTIRLIEGLMAPFAPDDAPTTERTAP